MTDLYVIKIGGNVIDNEENLLRFIKAFASIKGKKILVHGGGKLATTMAASLGIEQQMVDGRRITDAATLRIVTMVYAGLVNKTIVSLLQAAGCNAFGLCGADGNAILAHKRKADSDIGRKDTDYGFAGDIDAVSSNALGALLDSGYCPVMAPITHDGNGQLLNTNADTIASAVASAMGAQCNTHLVYCFEKSGVLLNVNDEQSVIPKIDPSLYEDLKADGKLFAGMLPKIDNAFASLHSGVKTVLIGHADDIVKNTSTEKAGTLITL